MKLLRLLSLVLINAFLFFPAMAQQEASHWFFSPGGYLNFNTNPPDKKINSYNGSTGQFMASIADAEGNLLFYTDGRTFFNSQHSIMENGQGSYGESVSSQTSYIIPKPGSDHLYYNFITELSYTADEFSGNGWTLHYSLVDISAKDGKGEVLIKKRVLNNGDGGDALTIFQASDGSSFWVVTTDSNGTELHAYKVTKDQVSHTPVVTKRTQGYDAPFTILKASPDNKHLAITGAHFQGYPHVLQVYNFNDAAGTFSPKFELRRGNNNYDPTQYPHNFKSYAHSYEFSADSRNLFIIEEDVQAKSQSEQTHHSSLLKYDLDAPNNQLFEASKVKLFDFPPANFGNVGGMQLSPDGRILIGSHQNFISAINLPEACNDFSFTYKAITFNEWPGLIPTFPAFYFRKNSPSIAVEALDIEACPGSMAKLQAIPFIPEYHYEWTNTKTSEKLFGANPTLHIPTATLAQPDTAYYYLKLTDPEGCYTYDSAAVIILPSRELAIRGSRSVCPGAEEIAYWIEGSEGNTSFNWQVEGGEIVSGQGTDRILVNWGGTKLDASLSLTSTNRWNCEDLIPDFKVKIFKELETEKPNGTDTLNCDSQYYYYSILPTNGSAYNWQIVNGEIVEGQGSAQIKVSWNEDSPQGFLWIEESVNTELETCFGRSDTLTVVNPGAYGDLNAELQLVSGVLQTPDVLLLRYEIKNKEFFEETFSVVRKEANNDNAVWQEIASISSEENEAILSEPMIDEVVYEYKITGHNLCAAQVESVVHNNIVLTGEIEQDNQQIKLAWNPYLGWSAGVKAYELYRRLDAAGEYIFLGTVNDKTAITLDNLSDGFDHCFYLKAISEDDNQYTSFSNALCLSYDHPVFIPNVITPNSDGKNDFLVIGKLELYPENELQVFNRYGKLVYQKKKYTNDWNADGLPNGVYYYHFSATKNQKSLRGWVQVIR